MSLLNGRCPLLLRSITYQLSCVTIRGTHHHSKDVYTAAAPTDFQTPLLLLNPLNGGLQNKDGGKEMPQYSPNTSAPLRLFERYRCLGGANVIINGIDTVKPPLKYKCPKVSNHQIEINIPSIRTILPISDPGTDMTVKISPGTGSVEKMAYPTLMRIRRRKMKKHRRKRRMKRIWPYLRRINFMKRQKKERLLQKKLSRMRSYGDDFDAMQEIKANLRIAKLKGYRHNIFSGEASSFANVLTEGK